jgi:hypothetical protein
MNGLQLEGIFRLIILCKLRASESSSSANRPVYLRLFNPQFMAGPAW